MLQYPVGLYLYTLLFWIMERLAQPSACCRGGAALRQVDANDLLYTRDEDIGALEATRSSEASGGGITVIAMDTLL